MAGSFTQFNAEERGYSDIAPPKAPVADTSGVHKINAVTGAINAVGSVFEAGASIYGKQKEAERVEALSANKESFEQDLLQAKDLADQGGGKSLKFNTFLTKKFDESTLDFDVKSKMLKDFQSTVLGKSFTEVSVEDETREANRSAAGKAGFWNSNSTEEEIDLGTAEYEKAQALSTAQTAEMNQLNLAKARRGATEAERQEVERLMGKKQYEAMANLAANYRTPVQNEVNFIVSQFQEGRLDRKSAEQALVVARGDLTANIAQITRGVDSAKVDPLSKPLLNVYDVAIANLDSKALLDEVTNANKMTKAEVIRNLQINDPELVEMAALSSMVGNASPTLQAKFGQEAAKVLKRNSDARNKPADPTEDSEGMDTYLGTLLDSAGKLDQIGNNNEPIIKIEKFVTNVDNVLSGGARYIDEDDNPVDNKKILEWLADIKIGTAIKDNLGSFKEETRGKLSDTLVKSAVNHIYPAVQSIIDGDLKPEEFEKVEITGQGNKVVFRAVSPEPWIKSVAAKLNREVGGVLSTYYNALGNVTGEGFSTVFDRERSLLWPDKYGEQQEPAAQESVSEIDYSQYEDGPYEDERTGDVVFIRNGIRIEGGD